MNRIACLLCLGVLAAATAAYAQSDDPGNEAIALPAARNDAETIAAPATPGSSAELRRNLEETIREGEAVLRDLPATRVKILRSRIANLERQLVRKRREERGAQNSLAILRADLYRQLGALQRGDPDRNAEQAAELREEYDVHAESLEVELEGLGQDLREIEETVADLQSRLEAAEGADATLPEPGAPEDAGDAWLDFPRQLDPYELRSAVERARGRSSVEESVVLALKAEIAFRQGDHRTARAYWEAALIAPAVDAELARDLRYNLSHLDYLAGDFRRCYIFFAEWTGGRPVAELAEKDAGAMAVLAYLNGRPEEARRFLGHAGGETRGRLAPLLGTIAGDGDTRVTVN